MMNVWYRGPHPTMLVVVMVLLLLFLTPALGLGDEPLGEHHPEEEAAASTSHVVTLTEAKFAELTKEGVWFVKFYAPWCGHCKSLAPVWEQLASELAAEGELSPSVHIAKVDATSENHLASLFGIQGYPTLKLLANGRMFGYRDSREVEKLKAFVKGGYTSSTDVQGIPSLEPEPEPEPEPSVAFELTDATFEGNISAVKAPSSEEVWFVKFFAPWCGACKALAPDWEMLAVDYRDHATIHIATVDATTNPKLKERFGINGYPTLILLHKGRAYSFSGSRTYDLLTAYVSGGFLDAPKGGGKAKSTPIPSAKPMEQPEDDQDPDSDVVVLRDSNFEVEVKMGFDDDWFVEFYASWCGHCKQLRPVWELLATELKPKGIRVGKMEANKNAESAKRFAVTGYPTLVLVHQGLYYDYSGGRTLDALVQFATIGYKNVTGAPIQWVGSQNASADVVMLTDSTFEPATQSVTGATSGDWFVDFYVPWCTPCLTLRPVWEYVASKLKGEVNVAAVDVSANPELAARFSVTSYPTLALLSGGRMAVFNASQFGRDVKVLSAFARKEGRAFASAKVKAIPPLLSVGDRVTARLDGQLREASRLYAITPLPVITLLLAGFLSGILTVTVVSYVACFRKWKVEKVD